MGVIEENEKAKSSASVRFTISRQRDAAYNKGHKDGAIGLYNANPYMTGSSYYSAYMDGFYDGRHGDE